MNRPSLARVETDRLVCERLRPDHAEDLIRLLRDPRVFPTTWPKPDPPSEVEVRLMLDAKIAHWRRHGFGYWLLRDRDTGEAVGRGGLQRARVQDTPETEVGWAIFPERWGQGLATELARASVQVAFHELCLSEIVAYAMPENLASRRVMEKAGFAYEREIVHAGLPHVLYRRRA